MRQASDPDERGTIIADRRAQPARIRGCDGRDSNCNGQSDEGFDFDGVGICLDCDAANSLVWFPPGEVPDLDLVHTGGITGTTTLSWSPPLALGGTSVVYDTLASGVPFDFSPPIANCDERNDGSDTMATNTVALPVGAILNFLIRAENAGPGVLGMGHSASIRPA